GRGRGRDGRAGRGGRGGDQQPDPLNQQQPPIFQHPPPHQHPPVFQQPPPNQGQNHVQIMGQFHVLSPPTFTGADGPQAVDDWFMNLERVFEVLNYSDQEKILCARFQMIGDAGRWWSDVWRLKTTAERDAMTREQMKLLISERYYPYHFREQMERQFYALQQGNLSVEEYEREFTRLSHFAPHMVDTDFKKSRRFLNGLQKDLRFVLSSHGSLTNAETILRAQQIAASQRLELDAAQQTVAQSRMIQPVSVQPPSFQPVQVQPTIYQQSSSQPSGSGGKRKFEGKKKNQQNKKGGNGGRGD
ncbi:Unknown protein, partial [Striga hermonthica]